MKYNYSEVKQKVEKIVRDACYSEDNEFGTTTWKHHILPVVEHSLVLGRKMKADLEVLELAALLHDYAGIKDVKMYKEHHEHGARLAGEILEELGYEDGKIFKIQDCILNHRARAERNHSNIESKILASADAMSHFSELADMFYLSFGVHGYETAEGAEWLKNKLQRSWKKIMPEGRKVVKKNHEIAMSILDAAIKRERQKKKTKMILPKTTIENEVLADGGKFVFGVDEVGRGPLAGPVVAGAAWVSPEILDQDFELRKFVRDSKTLSEKKRGEVYEYIKGSDGFEFGIGEVSNAMIDRLNILNATALAMRLAVEELFSKLKIEDLKSFEDVCLLVDGNRKIPKIKYKQRVFVKGDARIFSIAAASICAKVHRDTLMIGYNQEFPEYGFDSHKGYGTRKHIECLQKNGPCQIHRKSFGPVKNIC